MTSSAVQPIVALLSATAGGNPTQYMIEKAFDHHRLDWRYLTVEVNSDDLEDAIRGMRAMGFHGGRCDDPHKRAVVPMLDRTTEAAALIGAANLILREDNALVGENTEGKGVVASLTQVTTLAEKRAVLLGAGQMARAVAVELAAAGIAEIVVVNRDEARAGDLVETISAQSEVIATTIPWDDDLGVPAETDLLIHATSLFNQEPDAQISLNLDTLSPDTVVADVTFNPPQTRLLREADQRGCTTVDGLGMYIEQVALSFKLWTDVDPDRQVLREAIEEFLEL